MVERSECELASVVVVVIVVRVKRGRFVVVVASMSEARMIRAQRGGERSERNF